MATKKFLFIVFLLKSISLIAQQDSLNFQQKDSISLRKIKNIGIVEPFVQRNIPVIKNLIISTVKEELNNKYDYTILKNDSLLIAFKYRDSNYLNDFLNKNDFDAFMIIRHGFIEIKYKDNFSIVDRNFESQIEILLYNKNGQLLARSYENTNKLIKIIRNHNAVKTLKKATRKATISIIEQLNKINTNLL